MEILTHGIKLLFVLFLLYTLIYLLHWGLGLCISVHRLSAFSDHKRLIRRILPNQIARDFPVSVIIPAHNEETCICDTVGSLLLDDYPGLQIIVVDDGSTDQTAQRVREHFGLDRISLPLPDTIPTKMVTGCFQTQVHDKKILLICKENGGKSDALNCGLNFCGTPYCVVLDADTQVSRGSIRMMASRFLLDSRTIVCAGSIGSNFRQQDLYPHLSILQKFLVRFQQMEYYRTFYMQRLLFEQINANVIVSGAFAMFDTRLLRSVGGYRNDTIGEDMEIAMRLHAFCKSQDRPYRIAYMPEAQCYTQFPFRYRDFVRQRRRWHIGMLQCFGQHLYMLGNRSYGWAGLISGTFLMVYEFLAPFVELLGFVTLIAAYYLNILNLQFAWTALLAYALLSMLNQQVLLHALRNYQVEKVSVWDQLVLAFISLLEFLVFHPMNIAVKIIAVFMKGHHKSWEDIHRTGSDTSAAPQSAEEQKSAVS